MTHLSLGYWNIEEPLVVFALCSAKTFLLASKLISCFRWANCQLYAVSVLAPLDAHLPLLRQSFYFILGQAIVSAATSGSKQFFLGTDSAPHERRLKECPCGCAGIYNSPVALSLYAKVFEEVLSLSLSLG